ncbi:hypothetical protein [Rudanella paleaurantiibacter]|nr:hypothetical protein [Rudanella paleaurantiibacter]
MLLAQEWFNRFFSWLSLHDPTMKAAFIGAFVALVGFFIQDFLARKNERAKQIEVEQSKMKYLHFLITDSYKAIESFDSTATNVVRSFQENPFVLPGFGLYPAHSINAIANKINQEEYFLASVSQMKNYKLVEIFLIYNTMNEGYKRITEHFVSEAPKFIQAKDQYLNLIEELRSASNAYLQSTVGRQLDEREKIALSKIRELSVNLQNYHNASPPLQVWLYESNQIFVQPTFNIVREHGNQHHQELFNISVRATIQHSKVVDHMRNIVSAVDNNRKEMNSQIAYIRELTKPLNKYIYDLHIEKLEPNQN